MTRPIERKHMDKILVDAVNDATASPEQANKAITDAVLVLRDLRINYGDTEVLANLIWLLDWQDLVRYAALMDDSFIDFTEEGDKDA